MNRYRERLPKNIFPKFGAPNFVPTFPKLLTLPTSPAKKQNVYNEYFSGHPTILVFLDSTNEFFLRFFHFQKKVMLAALLSKHYVPPLLPPPHTPFKFYLYTHFARKEHFYFKCRWASIMVRVGAGRWAGRHTVRRRNFVWIKLRGGRHRRLL